MLVLTCGMIQDNVWSCNCFRILIIRQKPVRSRWKRCWGFL